MVLGEVKMAGNGDRFELFVSKLAPERNNPTTAKDQMLQSNGNLEKQRG